MTALMLCILNGCCSTELPEALRKAATEELFFNIVGVDPEMFADDLYMSADNIREMAGAGMHFGSHGSSHCWLNKENEDTQYLDIMESLKFLKNCSIDISQWVMCYPFGGFNDVTLGVLKRLRCSLGLTVVPAVADLKFSSPLMLPRLDTNDFPK